MRGRQGWTRASKPVVRRTFECIWANGAISHVRGSPHGEVSAAEFRVVGRFVGAVAALGCAGPARLQKEQPTDDGESSDGEVARGERPPLLPALTLPRRRPPRTLVLRRALLAHRCTESSELKSEGRVCVCGEG